jgi:hypothetical protein
MFIRKTHRNKLLYRSVLFFLSVQLTVAANQNTNFFEKKIRPVFSKNCYECHSAKSKSLKAGLLLDRKAGWERGGKNGAVIIPGEPAKSILINALRYGNHDLQMPPSGKLSETVLADFEKWISMGAQDPRNSPLEEVFAVGGLRAKSLEEGKKFWAFKPIKLPPLLDVQKDEWIKDEIDRFILRGIENKKLQPATKADPLTLLRRIFFDLTGLPPSPEDIKDFQESSLENSFEDVVDNLLESPRFGERWGRHWLDVARYADTTGGGRNNPFPNAHRYRDYVINGFNKDKPFDQFIMEQIAGDLMSSTSDDEYNEKLTGIGFLALGPHNYELQDKELLRMEVVDEQLTAVGKAFMGLTMDCARCHDHPFDPIPIQDYYSMAGIFRSTNSLVLGNVAGFHERDLRDELGEQRNQYEQTLASLEKRLKDAVDLVKSLGGDESKKKNLISLDPITLEGIVVDDLDTTKKGKWLSSTHTPGYVGSGYHHDDNSGKGNKSITYKAKIKKGGEYDVQVSYTDNSNRSKKTPVTVMHADGEQKIYIDQTKPPSILGIFTSVGVFRFEEIERDVVQITTEGTEGHVIADAIRLVAIESKDRPPSFAGESKTPEHVLVTQKKLVEVRKRVEKIKREIETHKKNQPNKVAKVMSVREQDQTGDWHIHLRGEIRNLGPVVQRGFLKVAMSDGASSVAEIPDGASGRLQLAEWIASPDNPLPARVYANRIWHHLFGRGIVASTDNFGEMGNRPTHPELLDFLANYLIENNWTTKSLIRKIVLSNTYQMSTDISDIAAKLDPENNLFSRQNRKRLEAEAIGDAMLFAGGQISAKHPSLEKKRLSFQKLNRNKLSELFEVFDYPNPGLVSGNRNTSSVPTQALYMLNNEFVIKQAHLVAKIIDKQAAGDLNRKITLAFLKCLGRLPNEAEMKASLLFLENKSQKVNLEGLVHSLFACLDFRYLN